MQCLPVSALDTGLSRCRAPLKNFHEFGGYTRKKADGNSKISGQIVTTNKTLKPKQLAGIFQDKKVNWSLKAANNKLTTQNNSE